MFMINTKSIWINFYIKKMWNTAFKCVNGKFQVLIKIIKLIYDIISIFFLNCQ